MVIPYTGKRVAFEKNRENQEGKSESEERHMHQGCGKKEDFVHF